MRRPGIPLFLRRGPYRRRRKVDASRLLPVFGAFLLLLPILWGPGADSGRSTVAVGVYLFLVWAGLILVARLLAPDLAAAADLPPEEAEEDAGTGDAGRATLGTGD